MADKHYYKNLFEDKQKPNIILNINIIENYKINDEDNDYEFVNNDYEYMKPKKQKKSPKYTSKYLKYILINPKY